MNSSNYPYIYNTVTFNDGSCYNASTGIFTASVRGYYQFHATFTGGAYTWLVKNGVPGAIIQNVTYWLYNRLTSGVTQFRTVTETLKINIVDTATNIISRCY